jgi:hypothetical protein
LRVAADDADVAGADALDLAAGGHHQHLVVVVDADDADHRPLRSVVLMSRRPLPPRRCVR